MSFNKNNPNTMGKIMGYLKQLSTEMGSSEQQRQRRGDGDEERLYRQRGAKYARVPSRPTLSASTTCTSLATSCGSSATLAHNTYAAIPEQVSTESSSEDEQETFEKTRRHFQQLRQISLGTEFKYKMEMEIKDDKMRKSVPFTKQIDTDLKGKEEAHIDINGDLPLYTPTTQKIYLWHQILATFAVSMGSVIVGFCSGYTSPALVSMKAPNSTLPITPDEGSWIGGLMPLAALVGGVLGGPLIEMLGRKTTIMATALPFFAGWMLIANATMIAMVYAGRALCGICVGIGSLAFPVYLGETIQPEVRGSLGLMPTAFGNIGILLTFLCGAFLKWNHLAFVGAALPLPFFLCMLLIPETPRWYLTHGRTEKAATSLQWLRGRNTNIEKEIKDLVRTQTEADKSGGSAISNLFNRDYSRAIIISITLMLFQQLSGINAVIFYAGDIFEMSGSKMNKDVSSVIIGIVNFISTFIAAGLIDRLGRKILLYISGVAMTTTLASLGAYFYLKSVDADVSQIGWLPLTSLVIYVLGFSLGFGPIPWLMMGEILPAKVRGAAASVATAINWSCTFLVTKTFGDIQNVIGAHGAFWLFGVISLIGIIFVAIFVPETKGKTLEDIEKKLRGPKRGSRRSEVKTTNGKVLS